MGLIKTYGQDLVGQYIYYLRDGLEVLGLVKEFTEMNDPRRSYAEVEVIVSGIGQFESFSANNVLDQMGIVISEKCAKFILIFADPWERIP